MYKFDIKLKTMTGRDVVLAMIAGLEKKWVAVNMSTFGEETKGVCFGCAATNTVCELVGKTFDKAFIDSTSDRAVFISAKHRTLNYFEFAVDQLRRGNIREYNWYISELGCGYKSLKLPEPKIYLPVLENETYKRDLGFYKDYANSL